MAAPAVAKKASASNKSATPLWLWEATTKGGEKKRGQMEAQNQEAVENRLKSLGMTPVKVKKKTALDGEIKIPGLGGVNSKDVLTFTRQLSTMIDAGLPLVQGLDIIGSQTPNPAFRSVVFAVKSKVESGSTFADALKEHPKAFDELYVQLCAAGEVGGILDTILQRLAIYKEKADKLKRKIKGAMTYPAVVLMVMFGVTALLLLKVTPTFEKMFKDFNSKLPALTQFVVDLSNWLQAYYLHIAGGIIVTVVTFVSIYRNPKGRIVVDKLSLKAPVVGDLIRKVAVARFTRTLSTMMSSGVPILDALDVTAKTAGNRTVESAITYVRAKIAEGKTITQPLADTKIFPSMVVQMIGVGEATGAMDAMLGKIADTYDDEVDQGVEALTSLIEPIMMVFIGAIVGGFLIAMYMPIFSIAGAIK